MDNNRRYGKLIINKNKYTRVDLDPGMRMNATAPGSSISQVRWMDGWQMDGWMNEWMDG